MRTAEQIRRRGFTLVETVVTVGIIAALAAVVYPTVVKQFDTADPTRAAEDLGNLTTAIETFGVNVRPNQPGKIEQLTNPLGVASATYLNARGAQYSLTDSTNWKGPYVGISVPPNSAANLVVITTGFGGTVTNRLSLFDLAGSAFGGDTVTTANVANAEFVAVRIGGLSAAAFNAINALVDGPSEVTVAQRRLAGKFRCPGEDAPGAAADTACTRGAFYLASPIR
jgi:prepilin-type N-terminal cleavage/methylation domain-containing protein